MKLPKLSMIKCHFFQDLLSVYFNVRMMQFHTQDEADQLIADIKAVRPLLLTHKEFVKRQLKRKAQKDE